jgi:hypothetical protein
MRGVVQGLSQSGQRTVDSDHAKRDRLAANHSVCFCWANNARALAHFRRTTHSGPWESVTRSPSERHPLVEREGVCPSRRRGLCSSVAPLVSHGGRERRAVRAGPHAGHWGHRYVVIDHCIGPLLPWFGCLFVSGGCRKAGTCGGASSFDCNVCARQSQAGYGERGLFARRTNDSPNVSNARLEW